MTNCIDTINDSKATNVQSVKSGSAGGAIKVKTRVSIKHIVFFLLESLRLWQKARRERLDLLRLDDRALKDIGLSRSDVDRVYKQK